MFIFFLYQDGADKIVIRPDNETLSPAQRVSWRAKRIAGKRTRTYRDVDFESSVPTVGSESTIGQLDVCKTRVDKARHIRFASRLRSFDPAPTDSPVHPPAHPPIHPHSPLTASRASLAKSFPRESPLDILVATHTSINLIANKKLACFFFPGRPCDRSERSAT